jgi:hypothetical protein
VEDDREEFLGVEEDNSNEIIIEKTRVKKYELYLNVLDYSYTRNTN